MLKLRFEALDIEVINTVTHWIYADSGTRLYMQPYQDSSLEDPKKIKGQGECDGYGFFLGDQLIGLFEYTFVEGELEIGYAFASESKGKGYGGAGASGSQRIDNLGSIDKPKQCLVEDWQ